MQNKVNSIDMTWIPAKEMQLRFDCKHYSKEYIQVKDKIRNMNHGKLSDFVVSKRSEPPIHTKMYGDKENEDIPIIRFADFSDFEFNIDQCLYLKKEYISTKTMSAFLLEAGEIVYGLVGDVGHGFVVPPNMFPAITYRRVAQLKLKGIDSYYVCTFINTKYGKIQFDALSTGVNQAQLRLEDSIDILIPIPSSEIQKYIGDKVRKAEELREESKKSKKKYECIIKDIYCDTDAKKFPSGIYFVNNYDFDEKNLRIDSNFYHPLYNYENIKCKHIIKLSELAKLKKNSKIMAKEEYIYYEIGDLSTSKVLEDKERIMGSKLPGRAKLELRMNDIIISLVQESIEVTSYVDMKLKNALTTNGCAVLEPKDKSLSAYLYAIMSSEFFIAQKCKYISGTNIRSMSKDDLLDMSIPIVEQKIIDKIVELVNIEFSNIRKAKQLIQEAKQDVEDLIEGKFDMSKLNETTTESR